MKSYFLAPITSRSEAVAALTVKLPAEGDTWLLKNGDGDVMAYFSLVEAASKTDEWTIQVDVSGRHYDRDADVVAVLETLRGKLGGEITNDA